MCVASFSVDDPDPLRARVRRAHRDPVRPRRDRRARLRRAAAGDGVRRGRLRRHGHRPLARARASRSPSGAPTWSTCPPSATPPSTASCAPRPTTRRSSELDALTICVPTPLSKTRTPDLSYVVSAAESVAEQLVAGPARDPAVHDLPGHDRAGDPADPRARRARSWGRTSSSATRPSAWTPATASGTCTRRRSSSAASPTSACAARSCSTRRSCRPSCRSRARWWPRRPSCTRTPSARSTSRSPTSSR